MKKNGPYDLVVFQAVVKHAIDPLKEIETIFENMTEGGYMYMSSPLMDFDGDADELKSAKSITLKDVIYQYHPGHVNYLTPRQCASMLKKPGFKITNALVDYPPAAPMRWFNKRYVKQGVKKNPPERSECSGNSVLP